MRSFFKKPSSATAGGGTGNDFYRRSQHTYSDIVAANRRTREARQKEEKNVEKEDDGPTDEPAVFKRARMYEEIGKTSPETEVNASIDDGEASPDDPDGIINSHHLAIHQTESPQSDIENYSHGKNTIHGNALSHINSTHRAKGTQADQESCQSPSVPPIHTISSPASDEESTARQDSGSENLSSLETHTPDPQPPNNTHTSTIDPIVKILITSDIPDTKALIFHRKLSQGLREVRLEWCKRQGFAGETAAPIFLTWRSRRLFDVTTCRSLGIQNDKGWLARVMDGDSPEEDRELRIHMEAVTDDPSLLARQSTSQTDEPHRPSPSPNPHTTSPQDDDQPMKLVLRSPELDDLRIKARPKTLVSKLISAFRERHSIEAGREVSLHFDGDRLEPHTCLADNDMADLDMLDVQVGPPG